MVLLHAPASGGGGIARYSRELGNALRASGEPVRDLRVKPWTVRVGGREFGGFVSIRAKSLFRPLVKRDVLHSTFHYAAHPRCDVVTVHDLFQQTLAPELGVSPAEVRRMDAQLRGLARRQVHFVCDSRATRSSLLARDSGVADEATQVVYPGVSERFQPPPLQRAGEDPEVRQVLCVADLNPRKRVDLLLEAAALASDSRLRFVLVGSLRAPRQAWEASQARIERLSHALGTRLEARGRVDEVGLLRAYQESDLLVMPSRDEGFGLPPLEALACGTSVAVADVPVFHEALGDQATYFQDVEGLAKVLEGLLRAPRSTQRERRSRHEWIRQRYGWDRAARQLMTLYDTLRSRR